MPKRLTIEEFIIKANKIHSNRYDYSKTNYKNNSTKVIIICPKHGEFLQTPDIHFKKNGCQYCSHKKLFMTNEIFIKKSKEIHGNKYDYSKINYINTKTKITIICKKHGEFLQYPNHHLTKHGCSICSKNKKLTTKEFIKKSKKIHGNKYDYSNVIYKNATTKIIIICSKHGKFLQYPQHHIRGRCCAKCKNIGLSNSIDFIKKSKEIHGNKYDYSKIDYIKSNKKVIIICKQHGDFLQVPNSHLRGNGCPKCSHIIFKGENIWLNNIEKNLGYNLKRNMVIYINNKRFYPDGFDPITNTCYEFYGDYWHGNPKIYNLNDINKVNKQTFGKLYYKTIQREKIIKSAGYNLITKWQSDNI